VDWNGKVTYRWSPPHEKRRAPCSGAKDAGSPLPPESHMPFSSMRKRDIFIIIFLDYWVINYHHSNFNFSGHFYWWNDIYYYSNILKNTCGREREWEELWCGRESYVVMAHVWSLIILTPVCVFSLFFVVQRSRASGSLFLNYIQNSNLINI